MIKYTYKNITYYFNLLKDCYYQDITKKVESDWFYVAKDYMFQTKINNAVNTFNFNFDILLNYTKKEEIKSIFKENFGKYGKFLLEVQSSLKIKENRVIGDNYIIINNSNNFESTINYKRYLVLRKNNITANIVNNNLIDLQLVKILDIQKIDDVTEKIIFEEDLTINLNINDCIINNLFLCRFDSDSLTFDKVDNKFYKTQLNFKELQQETI